MKEMRMKRGKTRILGLPFTLNDPDYCGEVESAARRASGFSLTPLELVIGGGEGGKVTGFEGKSVSKQTFFIVHLLHLQCTGSDWLQIHRFSPNGSRDFPDGGTSQGREKSEEGISILGLLSGKPAVLGGKDKERSMKECDFRTSQGREEKKGNWDIAEN